MIKSTHKTGLNQNKNKTKLASTIIKRSTRRDLKKYKKLFNHSLKKIQRLCN